MKQGVVCLLLMLRCRDLWEKQLPREMLYQLVVYAISHRAVAPKQYSILGPRGTHRRLEPVRQSRWAGMPSSGFVALVEELVNIVSREEASEGNTHNNLPSVHQHDFSASSTVNSLVVSIADINLKTGIREYGPTGLQRMLEGCEFSAKWATTMTKWLITKSKGRTTWQIVVLLVPMVVNRLESLTCLRYARTIVRRQRRVSSVATFLKWYLFRSKVACCVALPR